MIHIVHKADIFVKNNLMFELKSYTRKELSLLYFPDSSPRGAYLSLRRWLLEYRDSHPEVLKQIQGRIILRKCDVKLIVDLLGEP